MNLKKEWERLEEKGLVKFKVAADEYYNYEDLAGDTFNPEVNNDIPEAQLKEEEERFKDKINNDGVWGIVSKYFDGRVWVTADSVGGFVGDDYKDSGYDTDVMQSAIDQLKALKHCKTCKQTIPGGKI